MSDDPYMGKFVRSKITGSIFYVSCLRNHVYTGVLVESGVNAFFQIKLGTDVILAYELEQINSWYEVLDA